MGAMSEGRSPTRDAATPEEIRRGLLRRRRTRRGTAILLAAVVAGAAVLSISPAAGITSVEVRGADGVPVPQLEAATDLVGESIVWVDVARIEDRIEKVAWIERAKVTKDFLARRLDIEIVRRRAAGYVQSPQGLVLLDRAGVAFEVTHSPPPGALELTGDIAPAGLGSASEDASRVIFCSESLRRWTRDPFGAGGISSGVVYLVTSGGSVVRVGDTSDLEAKGRALRAMQERAAAEGWVVRVYTVVAPSAPALERA